MSGTVLNINDSITSDPAYNIMRYNFIRWMEQDGGVPSPTPYHDDKGLITIGVGFNLAAKNTRWFVLTTLRINNNSLTQYLSIAHPGLTNDQIQQDIKAKLGYELTFANTGQIITVFNELIDSFETDLTNFLAKRGVIIPNSPERIALLSLEWNLPDLLGKRLGAALSLASTNQSLARAEAWYQIRYAHEDENWSHRLAEAAIFGLYANPSSVTLTDAIAVYQMFTQYNSKILDDEKNQIASNNYKIANENITGAGFSVTAQPIAQTLFPAMIGLLNGLGQQDCPLSVNTFFNSAMSPLDIRAASPTNMSFFSGQNSGELLVGIGQGGKIIANGSNDTLVAGTGSQFMAGTNGRDTFVIAANQNGNTVIDDSGGKGSGEIFVGGKQLSYITPVPGQNFTWTDINNTQYVFNMRTDQLTITGGSLVGSGETIVIDNFNFSQAQTNKGYLGIHFNEQVAIQAGNQPLRDEYAKKYQVRWSISIRSEMRREDVD